MPYPSIQDLLAQLREQHGVDAPGDAEVAALLGMGGGNPSQRVRRWRTGQNENPRYSEVMRLLDLLGMLRVEGLAPTKRGNGRIVKLAVQVAEAAQELAEALTDDPPARPRSRPAATRARTPRRR